MALSALLLLFVSTAAIASSKADGLLPMSVKCKQTSFPALRYLTVTWPPLDLDLDLDDDREPEAPATEMLEVRCAAYDSASGGLKSCGSEPSGLGERGVVFAVPAWTDQGLVEVTLWRKRGATWDLTSQITVHSMTDCR